MPSPLAAHSQARYAALVGIAALVAGVAIAEPPQTLMARGDAAWERRAEGRQGGRADPGVIGEAVRAYQRALQESPDSITIRARLLRALWFQGQFATTEAVPRRAIYARGCELAEEGISRLAAEMHAKPFDPGSPETTAAAVVERPESAALFFWAAAHWGLWGEMRGIFAAARQGVAGKIRDYAETAVLIDERYETAGGRRILGRLHTEAPRIPFITGWVDRDSAVANLERAVLLAPDDPLNRLFLADALLRFRPPRRDEAVAMIEALVAELPRPGFLLHDQKTLTDAQQVLARAAVRNTSG